MKMYLAAVVAMFVGASCLFLTPYSPISFGGSGPQESAALVDASADPTASADSDALAKANTPGRRHIVVAVAPATKLSGDIEFLIDQVKIPGHFRPMIDGSIDMVLSAFDQDKPAGALIDLVEEKPNFIWCLPVNDIDAFEDLISNIGKVKKGDPISSLKAPGKPTLHYKQDQGYVYVTDDKANFEMAPEDPEQLFGNLVSDNLIFADFNFQWFAQEHRDAFWAGFSDGAGSDHLQKTLERWSEFAADADQFSVGLKIDQSTTQIVANTELTFVDGSTFSQNAAKEMENQPSRFAGFKRNMNTGFSLNYCSNTSTDSLSHMKQEIVKLYDARRGLKKSLLKYMDEPTKQDVVEDDALTQQILKIFDQAMETGQVDVGANFFFYKGQPNLALGCYVGDSTELKKVFENDIVKQLRESDKEFSIQKNIDQHNDIVFHQFTSPNDEFFHANFGMAKRSDVVVGFGDDVVYFARGNVALKALKRCIAGSEEVDGQSTETDSMCSAQFRAIPWFNLPGDLGALGKQASAELKGQDKLGFVLQPINNGFQTTTSIDIGLITGTLAAVQVMGQQANAKFDEISRELEASSRN